MKKIHIPVPVPTKRDAVAVAEKTADVARLTGTKLARARRSVGRYLIRKGHKLASAPHSRTA